MNAIPSERPYKRTGGVIMVNLGHHVGMVLVGSIMASCSQHEFSGDSQKMQQKPIVENQETELGGVDSPTVTVSDSTVKVTVSVDGDDGSTVATPTPTSTCSDPFAAVTADPGETDKVITNPQPSCFNFVSAVCVGGGGGGQGTRDDDSGGGGGALVWFHNKPFVSSDIYKATAGRAGTPGNDGGASHFKVNDVAYIVAAGGKRGANSGGGAGGRFTITSTRETGVEYGGGNGGNGGKFRLNGGPISAGGGGGAGGYAGNGGNGANNVERGKGSAGLGGAGGGGAGCEQAGKGGGVGLFGKGSDGAGGGFSGRCKSDERGKTGFHGSHFEGIAVYGGGASGQSERGVIPADPGKCRIVFSKDKWNWLSRTP